MGEGGASRRTTRCAAQATEGAQGGEDACQEGRDQKARRKKAASEESEKEPAKQTVLILRARETMRVLGGRDASDGVGVGLRLGVRRRPGGGGGQPECCWSARTGVAPLRPVRLRAHLTDSRSARPSQWRPVCWQTSGQACFLRNQSQASLTVTHQKFFAQSASHTAQADDGRADSRADGRCPLAAARSLRF
jgi:hypothetical protein